MENNKKIVILQGVPASGKSTYAKELHEANKNCVIISMDALRESRGSYWIPEQESYIAEVEEFQVISALKNGLIPVIDDTNLNPKTIAKWEALAAKEGATIEYKKFIIDYETACKRDEQRGNKVGRKVIESFFKKYFPNMITYHDEYTCRNIHQKEPGKMEVIICDLDGTISLMKGRNPYDYHRVNEDLPEWRLISMLKSLADHYPIIFLTGRDGTDECKELTVEWITKNFMAKKIELFQDNGKLFREWNWDLYMRAPGDKRPDWEVKYEIYDKFIAPNYQVINIFEDRDSVVKMWRDKGLLCSQVYWGNF